VTDPVLTYLAAHAALIHRGDTFESWMDRCRRFDTFVREANA
jgi:hypothetical protein